MSSDDVYTSLADISLNTKYKMYNLRKIEELEQSYPISKKIIEDIKIVGRIFPFKVNNYVLNELIDWNNIPDDPIFRLNFPHKEMLLKQDFNKIKESIENGTNEEINQTVIEIHNKLNRHAAGQKDYNVPKLNEEKLPGVQHKYRETALFFPSQGQTCHAFCTFCFRWPQFIKHEKQQFAMKNVNKFVEYLQENEVIQDILFTGGDPMTMSASVLRKYIQPILEAKLKHLKTLRIGTKSLAYWPQKYLTDKDTEETIQLFSEIIDSGLHLTIIAHFNHPKELKTEAVKKAIEKLRDTGLEIRTQSPILNHINASSEIWVELLRKEVDLGLIPYYMFVARNTGAQHYFAVPLIKAWKIFQKAYKRVSGICRTIRGPVMSTTPGKIQVLGTQRHKGKRAFVLRFIQGRNPDWVAKPFYAKYDSKAIWFDELKPITNERFFFEEELERHLRPFNEIEVIKDQNSTRDV